MSNLTAFGGGPLAGKKLVRFVYMDESGATTKDRHTIVAALVIHADDQLHDLENDMVSIRDRYIPEVDRPDFFFRGSDLVNGNGYFRNNPAFDRDTRLSMLEQLCSIPSLYRTPVVYGHADDERLEGTPDYAVGGMGGRRINRLMLAHLECVFHIERVMRERFHGEVAQLVAENNNDTKRGIDYLQRMLVSQNAKVLMLDPNSKLLPLQTIRTPILFCGKTDSSSIQLADICAYVIRGKLAGSNAIAGAFEAISPALLFRPSSAERS